MFLHSHVMMYIICCHIDKSISKSLAEKDDNQRLFDREFQLNSQEYRKRTKSIAKYASGKFQWHQRVKGVGVVKLRNRGSKFEWRCGAYCDWELTCDGDSTVPVTTSQLDFYWNKKGVLDSWDKKYESKVSLSTVEKALSEQQKLQDGYSAYVKEVKRKFLVAHPNEEVITRRVSKKCRRYSPPRQVLPSSLNPAYPLQSFHTTCLFVAERNSQAVEHNESSTKDNAKNN